MTVVKIAVVFVFLCVMALVLYNMGAFDPGLPPPPHIEPIFDSASSR